MSYLNIFIVYFFFTLEFLTLHLLLLLFISFEKLFCLGKTIFLSIQE